jgi:superfamily II DNA or RNA helicase
VTGIQLRDYQREAVQAVELAWRGGLTRPAIVLPTGAGKTVVLAEQVRRWLREHGRPTGRRAIVLQHRDELGGQNANKLRDALASDGAGWRVGRVQAARNETLADVVVASAQTLARPARRRQLLDVGLVVVDECHHATAPTYVDTLRYFGCLDSSSDQATLTLGCTATMSRGDKTALGDIWQDVVFERSIAWMISKRWLVRPRGIRVRVASLDLSGVRRSSGDYAAGSLGAALEESLAPEAVAKAMTEHVPPGTRPTILFAPTKQTAQLFADALEASGYTTATVTDGMPTEARREALDAFRAGSVQVLCNCMIFTEGTDLPMASCAVIARPTRHAGLYVQMVGRVLRLWPGKDDALVLDVVGASARHGLSAGIELFGEKSIDDSDKIVKLEQDDLELDDDELTLDTIGEALDVGDVADSSWINGPITSEIVDLFHGSQSAWMRTRAGVWFLATKDRYVVILRAGAYGGTGYVVVSCFKDVRRWQESRFVVEPSLAVSDLSYAMAYAESDIRPGDELISRRSRPWRKSHPSDKQRQFAARLGIMIEPGMSAGELSNLMEVELASRRIDTYLRMGMT